MKLLWGVVILFVLVACVQVEQPQQPNETKYVSEVIQANKTVENTTALPKNVTKNPTKIIVENMTNESTENVTMNQSNATDNTSSNGITGGVVTDTIDDLTVGAAYKMMPQLEELVKNSSCYNLTWNGLDEQQQRRPLEVKKEIRFEYIGGRLFKGWINFIMQLNGKMIDSETASLTVEDLQVTCLDTENFTINWDDKLRRYLN